MENLKRLGQQNHALGDVISQIKFVSLRTPYDVVGPILA